MIIRYYDKDGKKHTINLENKGITTIFIETEIFHSGGSDKLYSNFRIDLNEYFNKETGQYVPSGCIELTPSKIVHDENFNPQNYKIRLQPGIILKDNGRLVIGPLKNVI